MKCNKSPGFVSNKYECPIRKIHTIRAGTSGPPFREVLENQDTTKE
jgi:hypothetical protein